MRYEKLSTEKSTSDFLYILTLVSATSKLHEQFEPNQGITYNSTWIHTDEVVREQSISKKIDIEYKHLHQHKRKKKTN